MSKKGINLIHVVVGVLKTFSKTLEKERIGNQ